MRSITLRKVDDAVHERLRTRATTHGVSMEEEARRILRRAVLPPERIGDLALKYFGQRDVELQVPAREVRDPEAPDE